MHISMHILKKTHFHRFTLNCTTEKSNTVFLDVCISRDHDLCIYTSNLSKFLSYHILSLKEIDL